MVERWIVVGAGSAGCVVASRLSEDASRHVLLLDDGPDLVAGSVPAGIEGPNFFAALAEPGRTHADLLASRTSGGLRTVYQRGRGVGGSSAVNAMLALRGSPSLYERWGWHDAAPMWDRLAVPTQRVLDAELGAVDRALLAADVRAEVAHLTRRDGRRVTSAEAYLWPALRRANLEVRAASAVDAVLFDDRRAVGVRLVDESELVADRVVLAAGAIHSPVILLRSGVDTPGIGHGLQDHPSAVLTLALRSGFEHDPARPAIGSVMHAGVGDATVQLLPMNTVGVGPEVAGLGALLVGLMTPVGRAGQVSIDERGRPVVDFALLDHPEDLVALAAGVRLALEVLGSAGFEAIVDEVFIDNAGTPASALADEDRILGWLRENCGDYVHASSTCAMGTVVDDRGSVFGYQGLSVCDASIFPSIPDANTHLPTSMAAELLCARGF